MLGMVGLILILPFAGTAVGVEDACRWEPPERARGSTMNLAGVSGDKDLYTGMLRVFVTEINGRWKDDDNIPFKDAFLAFALEEYVFLSESDTLQWDVQWDGHDYEDADGINYGNLREDNVKVIAAVYNSAAYPGYSNPPSGAEFAVHEVDATAAAISGQTGYNQVTEDFTHTVFVEDGSTTW
jgi:hypothetical protein